MNLPNQVPKWFYAALFTLLFLFLPALITQATRIAVLETKVETMDAATERVISILDKFDKSVNQLDRTVASLKTQVRYLEEN